MTTTANSSRPAKGPFVREITDGAQIDGVFLVKSMSRGETKTGNPYLMLTLSDRTGEIAGRVWDNADALATECPAGGFVRVNAQAQAYRDVVQLKINGLAAVPVEAVDLASFVPSTDRDVESMTAEFFALIDSVADAPLKTLLHLFFDDPELFASFKKAPAAKHMHHAYIGGLLEHTLGVMRLVDAVCKLYPGIDRSILITGAALHDIAKIREFSSARLPFDYTDEGRLNGHLMMGVGMIGEKIGRIAGFPDQTAQLLQHLVLSHHGRHEFGSPVLPMTMEAFALHFLDDIDAKENYFRRLGASRESADDYGWSEYQRTLDRFLLVRKTPPPLDHLPADPPYPDEIERLTTPAKAPDENPPAASEKKREPKPPRKPDPEAQSRQPTLF